MVYNIKTSKEALMNKFELDKTMECFGLKNDEHYVIGTQTFLS